MVVAGTRGGEQWRQHGEGRKRKLMEGRKGEGEEKRNHVVLVFA
jgi:hypothetical protein